MSLVLWYDVLFQVNFVSKELQGKAVDLSTAMDSYNNLITWLRKMRVDGFVQILVTAKELAKNMKVVAIFPYCEKSSAEILPYKKKIQNKELKITSLSLL